MFRPGIYTASAAYDAIFLHKGRFLKTEEGWQLWPFSELALSPLEEILPLREKELTCAKTLMVSG